MNTYKIQGAVVTFSMMIDGFEDIISTFIPTSAKNLSRVTLFVSAIADYAHEEVSYEEISGDDIYYESRTDCRLFKLREIEFIDTTVTQDVYEQIQKLF